ncbi:Intradiol ring-cleavage dioxygenase [Naviculisporaceae sp. PSN 640]
MHLKTLFASLLAAGLAIAHPGHNIAAEIAESEAIMAQMSHRSLDHYAEEIRRSSLEERAIARRNAYILKLIEERSETHRIASHTTPINTNHKSSKNYTLNTPVSEIFATNATCILSPEVTEGPYYVTGELIRTDLTDKEPGLPLYLDIQVLNIKTCKPVPNAYVEVWHTNATGVYSGVVANGNGNFADKTNTKKTYNRGVQPTTTDGVVQFKTIFPGHYTGRTTHTHVMVHTNAVALANGTIKDTTASHVGQFFYDQTLINEVTKLAPYSGNRQTLTLNSKDGILRQASVRGDPFVNYVYLGGGSVSGGLLGWIAFGIDTTLAKKVSAAGQFNS